ncbi:MAG TPA: hypothetical protein VGC55_03115 [Dokdonella sp.]
MVNSTLKRDDVRPTFDRMAPGLPLTSIGTRTIACNHSGIHNAERGQRWKSARIAQAEEIAGADDLEIARIRKSPLGGERTHQFAKRVSFHARPPACRRMSFWCASK